MALILTFLLGIANFALHQAVLRSGHPLIRAMPLMRLGARLSLGAEFVVLLAALMLVGHGYTGWVWAYLGYSALNALGAWIILSRRL